VSDLRLAERALRDRYPMDAARREFIVQEAERLARTSLSERVRIAALRVLLAADAINVRREANAVEDHSAEREAALNALREWMASPEGRAQFRPLVAPPSKPPPGQLPSLELTATPTAAKHPAPDPGEAALGPIAPARAVDPPVFINGRFHGPFG
jgi:hypothetical protein